MMGRKIEGGIKEHQDLVRFTASSADIAPKDQIDLMARCWFSLTAGRTDPIEHKYTDAKSGLSETVRITGSAEHGGIATIHDQDLLIFVMSQWIDAQRLGLSPSRRIHFTPYQFITWMNRTPGGGQYQRLKDALQRLKMTNIQTSVRAQAASRPRNRIRQFSWISEWEITTEEEGEIRGVEVVLAEWLFESIQNFNVLTLDKRYFDIPGGVERWLYLYARKATGGAHGVWKETFRSLYLKSASQQEYKHFASALRKLVEKDNLPGLKLAKVESNQGKDMLRMERTEKRQVIENKATPANGVQIELIERTPLEEAWENVFEIMGNHLGQPTANSWLKDLRLVKLENGTLTLQAKTKFIADHVESHFRSKLLMVWQTINPDVAAIRVEAKAPKRVAA